MPPILHPGIDCHLDISVLGTVELEAQVIYRKKKEEKKKGCQDSLQRCFLYLIVIWPGGVYCEVWGHTCVFLFCSTKGTQG